ncbi:M20/M25/M40 family metallo-hydrolase [Sphingomonas gilva]|uniref:M20/M25/M40 family metallo-hydrolase n=1 Tax=Sphingomonas gilva TaxID=2305907 RepID=A0A396RRT7_9SPHN|nr:M20/M25/M40 family metallo-hydrolase [Sphingomonas gilva]RHW19119.1 M20/M25/M40 family metallo-hydrolase [Sphingomonas gilva]
MHIRHLLAAAAALALAAPSFAQDAPHQKQAREIYAKVIGFRTAEGQGKVPEMARYLADVLKAGGVAEADIAMLPSGETTAMLVRVPGSDANARPILFSAHMDIVDARPEDWSRDPFTLVEEDGRFWGRGTHDNKAGVTAMVSTILRLKADKARPKRTLVFAFVGDEETGMVTTGLVAGHDWVKTSEFAINTDAGGGGLSPEGKPLIYLVQGAEKTYATFELTATNPGGHSSRPRKDNAIYDLARAITRVEGYAFPVMSNALTRAYIGAVGGALPGAAGQAMKAFAADPTNAQAIAAISTDPSFNGTIRTTCVATMLEAGHAENALPQKAKATVNCRIFPGVPVADVKAKLVEVVADPKIEIEAIDDPQASPVSEMRPDVMAAITRSIHKRQPGVPISPYLESGGTDGKVYRTAGIPTFATSGLFIRENEMFAHGLNERLPVESFYDGLEHIHDLALDLGGVR